STGESVRSEAALSSDGKTPLVRTSVISTPPAGVSVDSGSHQATIDQAAVRARERNNVCDGNILIVGMELLYIARAKHNRLNALSTEETCIKCKVTIPWLCRAKSGTIEGSGEGRIEWPIDRDLVRIHHRSARPLQSPWGREHDRLGDLHKSLLGI